MDALRDIIPTYEVISFDIFDTLLVRPYVMPHDVFLHLEAHYHLNGFAKARIDAEVRAMRKLSAGVEEVTFEQIYAEIDSSMTHMQAHELAWELQTLQPNPLVADLYKLAVSTGKNIVIVSDTYLPESFIVNLLARNGFDADHTLFLSSSLGKTKRSGNLYPYVLESLGVSPDAILHIGDNITSDIRNAAQHSIASRHIPRISETFLSCHKRVERLLTRSQTDFPELRHSLSMLAALSAIRHVTATTSTPDFWFNIGYTYAGPLVYSFTKWVAHRADVLKVKNVLFIARDGYVMQPLFTSLKTGITSHYLYASRNVINDLHTSPSLANDYSQALDKAGILNESALMVDAGSVNFTTQRFLKTLIPDITGAYWCNATPPEGLKVDTFYSDRCPDDTAFAESGLNEFFLTSPEPPVASVTVKNGQIQPIYQPSVSVQETMRSDIVRRMQPGILAYAHDMERIFGNYAAPLPAHAIVVWNNLWLKSPTHQEVQNFNKLSHASDAAHLDYIPMFHLGLKARAYRYGHLKLAALRRRFASILKRQIFSLNIPTKA